MGVSIGTVPTVAHAALRPEDVNAVVLDGAISLRIEVERFEWLLAGIIEPFVSQFDSTMMLAEQIRHMEQPTIAFVYGQDEYATSANLARLMAQSPATVTIVEFPDLPHARGPYLETATYFYELERFLTSVWSPLPERHTDG